MSCSFRLETTLLAMYNILNAFQLQNNAHPVAVESLSAGEVAGHALLERKNLNASDRADSLQAFVLIVALFPHHAH